MTLPSTFKNFFGLRRYVRTAPLMVSVVEPLRMNRYIATFILLTIITYTGVWSMEHPTHAGTQPQIELKDLYFGEDPKRFGPLTLPAELTDQDHQDVNALIDKLSNVIYPSHPRYMPPGYPYHINRNVIAKAIISGEYHPHFVDAANTYQDYYAWQHLINNRAKIKEMHKTDLLYENHYWLDKWEPIMPHLKSPMIIELFYKADQRSIEQKDPDRRTIVHRACNSSLPPSFLAYCLMRYPQAVYLEDRFGLTPLNILCANMLHAEESTAPDLYEKLMLLKKAKAYFWHRYSEWQNGLHWVREAIDLLKDDSKFNMNTALTLASQLEAIMNEQHATRETKKNEAKNEDCTICLESMSSGFLRILCCEHVFHVRCVFTLKECPICRAPIYNG